MKEQQLNNLDTLISVDPLSEIISKLSTKEGLFAIKALSLVSQWFYRLRPYLQERWLQGAFKTAGKDLYRLYSQLSLDLDLSRLMFISCFGLIRKFPQWEEQIGSELNSIKNEAQECFIQLKTRLENEPEIAAYIQSSGLPKEKVLLFILSQPLAFSFIQEDPDVKNRMMEIIKASFSQVEFYQGGWGLLLNIFEGDTLKDACREATQHINTLIRNKENDRFKTWALHAITVVFGVVWTLIMSIVRFIRPLPQRLETIPWNHENSPFWFWLPLFGVLLTMSVCIFAIQCYEAIKITKESSSLEEKRNRIQTSIEIGTRFSQVAFFPPEKKQLLGNQEERRPITKLPS